MNVVARVRRPDGSEVNLSSQFACCVLLAISLIFHVSSSLPSQGICLG